jgi:hypothetical protein
VAVVNPFQQINASLPPLAPPPPFDPNAMAELSAPAPLPQGKRPQVFEAPQPPSPQDRQETMLGGRLEQDYQKDLHPFGTPENHPGVWGKIGHALSYATGGPNRRLMEEQGIEGRLNKLAELQAQMGVQGAQAGNLTAEAGKNTEETREMPAEAASKEGLEGAETENQKSEAAEHAAAVADPPLAIGYAHAVNAALKAGRDPATDPIVQHLSDAITSIQKQTAPKGAHFIQREINGKPHTVAVDDLTGADIKDEGETGEKPPVVNVNAGEAALDREATRLGKPYEKGVSDANAQLEKIADARTMINGSAEAQALGVPKVLTALVSGQGSGVRITQPELNAIAKARGLAGDVQGTLNSWAGKGKLTPEQQQQLTGILDDVQQRILAKQAIHSAALDSINGAASRQDVIKADKEARQKINDLEKGATSNSPKPGTVENGYRFRGGDPARQENWEKAQ